MPDDHKFSIGRLVVYEHLDPMYANELYGPGGPHRTYGWIEGVYFVEVNHPHWEYEIVNSLTGERCRVPEERIFHGADRVYLDIRRRDDIAWFRQPPETICKDVASRFWRYTLRQFLNSEVPRIIECEKKESEVRDSGRCLELEPGDYLRVRGDLRPEMEQYHNQYAKVLEVLVADRPFLDVLGVHPGLIPGRHKVLTAYRVQLDDGNEALIYDVEVKAVYTSRGRRLILNRRAALFLAETFGDNLPHDVQIEYLSTHVFSRSELKDMSDMELCELLANLLYAKGLITKPEILEKTETFSQAPRQYLVDQILAQSRFDTRANRELTEKEIQRYRSQEAQFRRLLE